MQVGVFDERLTPTRITSALSSLRADWPSSWARAKIHRGDAVEIFLIHRVLAAGLPARRLAEMGADRHHHRIQHRHYGNAEGAGSLPAGLGAALSLTMV